MSRSSLPEKLQNLKLRWLKLVRWLYVLIMSCACWRVNPHSILACMSRNSFPEAGAKFEICCNWTQTLNNLVHKQTLYHLAKLVKWLRNVANTYLYGTPNCMFLPCQVHISKLIHTECQEPSSSKHAQNLKFKWLQLDSNQQPLTSSMNT